MRCSLRKVIKITICLFILVFSIILYLHDNFEKSLAQGQSLGQKQHGVVGPVDQHSDIELSRKQRNAMSVETIKDDAKEKIPKVQPSLKSKNKRTEIDDIFIAIKTTKRYHDRRLKLLLNTWVALAREETYIFTDGDDKLDVPEGHLINTNCSNSHYRIALSCKMAVEYDFFMITDKRWFCHLDDDTYLNVPGLVKLLQTYNHTDDWYLGRPSLRHPIEVMKRSNPEQKIAFWFATGGAGFCISRSLALKMMPHASGGRFMTTSDMIRLPDDCTVGYIINNLLQKELTVIDRFHSHLEALWWIHNLTDQLTFSYSDNNIVHIDGFSKDQDPTRLYSLHCMLFPASDICDTLRKGLPIA
ncbi:fringe glycosyltransferase-like [Mizuhopecten yessoensis]|uniref:Fringe glycosyltransferase n=1 Tax=Mizuhopecten yessoensis TaxID=6573 RepID=A0A210QI83_MIZYE|nr:fringe glycosyltransferase-like [Mizuhopecten yessoensis]OWF48473.1 Fringe glycosyltransferase [Mizuhopecten yessoensis]